MKTLLVRFLPLFIPVLLAGQITAPPPITPMGPSYPELKAYLNLTDSQLQQLQTVQASWGQATQAISAQISDKYSALYSMLGSGTGTAVQLGQLLLDIQALQKQLPVSNTPYMTQALAVLTADQKAKLPVLTQALQLQTTSYEAINLLLIAGPPSSVCSVPVLGAVSSGVICPVITPPISVPAAPGMAVPQPVGEAR